MRLLSWAGVATLLATSAATAADLPIRPAPAVYVPAPIFSWTGFYVGGNAGYAFSLANTENTTAGGGSALGVLVSQSQLDSGTVPASQRLSQSGFAGGAQLGYNYQFGGNVVAGVEADIDYMNLRNNDVVGAAFGTTDLYHARLSYLGTARARLGFVSDRVMVYATGGFAYGQTGYAHTYASNQVPPVPIFSGGRSGMQVGYAAGVGAEYPLPLPVFSPLGGAVTIRAEFLYYDLGSRTTTIPFVRGAIPSTLSDQYKTSGGIVRAGLNFKFGDPAAPVIARY